MPTYNGVRYLREQLDSIFAQTMLPDEVIIVDDCSTDGTVDLLEEYAKEHPIVLLKNTENLGINANFTKGIGASKGDYIFLSDQDDVWLPTKIEKTYRKLVEIERHGMPACVSSHVYDVDANLQVYNTGVWDDSTDGSAVMKGFCSQGCTLGFNRLLADMVLPFPMQKNLMYDAILGIVSYLLGSRYVLGEKLMYYRHHSSNAVGQVSKYHQKISNKYQFYLFYDNTINKMALHLYKYILDTYGSQIDKNKVVILEAYIRLLNKDSYISRVFSMLSFPYFSIKERLANSALLTALTMVRKIRKDNI